MKFGLKEKDIESIVNILKKYRQIKAAVMYGSRVLGTYKPGSDIDIALKGDISFEIIPKILYDIDEKTVLPYYFDFVIYSNITNKNLKNHIDTYGKSLF